MTRAEKNMNILTHNAAQDSKRIRGILDILAARIIVWTLRLVESEIVFCEDVANGLDPESRLQHQAPQRINQPTGI